MILKRALFDCLVPWTHLPFTSFLVFSIFFFFLPGRLAQSLLYILFQGFTYPVRAYFLENILEMTRYRLNTYNQIDDYGQEKSWKMQKQALALRKRKSSIASAVEVCESWEAR